LVESFLIRLAGAIEPGAEKFKPAAAMATFDGEGKSGVIVPLRPSYCPSARRTVPGGLSPVGEWCTDPALIALVEARGVAGAVLGNSGGLIFMGSGNKDSRCLLRRRKPNLFECILGVMRGFGVFSNETCPAELASEREESDARGTEREREDLASRDGSASPSGDWVVDSLPGSSNNVVWLLMNLDPNGPRFISELVLLSVEVRKSGTSADEGSKDRRRRLNWGNRPLRFGNWSSCSTSVGAVVMMAGVPAGIAGTGGACSFAFVDSCESEAWRNLIKLKRRVPGVCCWMGGEGGAPSVSAASEGLATSLDVGRRPSSETAMRCGAKCSEDLFAFLSPRRKRLAGSSVLRRCRSRSLGFGLSDLKGIALCDDQQLMYAMAGVTEQSIAQGVRESREWGS
jgi:hypothetical protein